MIIIFGASGYYLIQDKKVELNHDIYQTTYNFSKLTTEGIVKDYKLYYASGFATFKRNMESYLSLNTDIENVSIVDYDGNIVYDYLEEKSSKHTGETRSLSIPTELERVKDVRSSMQTLESERIVFINIDSKRTEDLSGNALEGIQPTEQIKNIIFPYIDKNGGHEYSVIFSVTYKSLSDRIAQMTRTILFIVGIALIISLIFAITLASKIVRPLKDLAEGAKHIARGNLQTRINIKTHDELKILGDTFNQMAKDLDSNIKELVEKQRMAKELEIAGNIQRNLLPSKLPELHGLEVIAHTIPAGEVGGDSYDFIQVDKDKTAFYIGDVTGHGVPSGLVMAVANALIYSFSKIYHTTKEIVVNTNRVLTPKTNRDLFMTLCLFVWDAKTERLTFTGAGHEPFVYYSHLKKSVSKVKSGGMILGTLPDIEKVSNEQMMQLDKGDMIVLYTDGVTEALNEEGNEMYGLERLMEVTRKLSIRPNVMDIFKGIFADLQAFMGKASQRDDITLIVIRRT
jgi:serine phosphatase RsbU (regulator of sigma subunit)